MLRGIMDPMLRVMGGCADNKGNECRNLHLVIHNSGKTLPVEVSTVKTKILILKGKPKAKEVEWPVLLLSNWFRTICASGGHMMLAGHSLDEPDRFGSVFQTFWERFQFVNPEHSIYDGSLDLRFAIPVACHGDEGRGKLKRPVMILSFQPIISVRGPRFVNSSGYLAIKHFFWCYHYINLNKLVDDSTSYSIWHRQDSIERAGIPLHPACCSPSCLQSCTSRRKPSTCYMMRW